MDELVKCPGCNGYGFYKKQNEYGIFMDHMCLTCLGSGKVGKASVEAFELNAKLTDGIITVRSSQLKKLLIELSELRELKLKENIKK